MGTPDDGLSRWALGPMTALNRQIIEGARPAADFPRAAATAVAAVLAGGDCDEATARRLVVLLGLVGAGLARHHQELDPAHKHDPEASFATVPGFLDAFTRLAARTGTGHPPRDAYASLTRWNLPPSEVRWRGAAVAVLPSAFDDGEVRTYTGATDEVRFFELIKLSETYERAVNDALDPIAAGAVDPAGAEATERLSRAAVLLEGMRRLNADFAALPPADGLRIGHFLDVFRQFAVHWRPGDLPPSGALDPEAIERDFRLGVDPPGYRRHVRRLLPGMLDAERARLDTVQHQPSVPDLVLTRCGRPAGLGGLSDAALRSLVAAHPVLAALFLAQQAHARVAGVHLLLARRFLFGPQQERDRSGHGDPGVVSNRRGTTGMDESALRHLTRLRQQHHLSALRALPLSELERIAGVTGLLHGGGLSATLSLPCTAGFVRNGRWRRPGWPVPRPRAAPDVAASPAWRQAS
ncbi:hypothetical protein [Dactylosporangium sp. CA-139066]|uniref:hypothetical protein n=1 Tax=Dactylosporangium sp. CA-139066 TaxID=3239930 RepID=UPI003D8AB178